MRVPALDFFVGTIIPRQLAVTTVNERRSPTPAVGAISGPSTRPSTANHFRTSPPNIPPSAASTSADSSGSSPPTNRPTGQLANLSMESPEASSVPAAPLLSQSNEDDKSEEDSTDDNDGSGDDEQGTSSRGNGESAYEDESADFFGATSGEDDYAVADFSVQQRVMHFLRERIDNRKNRQNVEICLLVEAGSSVSKERATTSDVRNQMMLERYVNLVRSFQADDFASPSVQEEMAMKLFNAKKGITGARLWKKFEDWRKEIRTLYTPKLPSDLSSIPSGQQLRDVYKKFIVDRFREENEEKCKGYENEDVIPFIPDDYWLKGIKTRCLLACMVHRSNKEIATYIRSLHLGQTREQKCESAAERVALERQLAQNSRKRDNDEEDATHKRPRNHIGQMSVIKSQNNVVSVQLRVYSDNDEEDATHKRLRNHIGQMSVIKSQNDVVSVQLRLYNENREAFIAIMGEDAYNRKIIDLLNKLPDPSLVNNQAGDTNSNAVDVAGSVGDDAE